jgi:polar amino acid transport system substrate-binding protein
MLKSFVVPFAIAAGLLLAAPIPASGAEVLRVGTECTYFPFNYRDSAGNLLGYDVDVATEVGKRIGAEIEFVCQEWDGMIPALLANKFDLIVASLSITEQRREKIDFSVPYRVSIGQFIGAKDKNLQFFNADGSVNPAGFEGVRVGIERASTYDTWIHAKMPDADIIPYDSNEAMYLDLKAGRVDAIMTNPMKAHLVFLSKPDGQGFESVGPQVVDEEFFGIGVGIGVRKDSAELLRRIDEALVGMIKDGSLSTYSRRYFPFDINPTDWAGTN